MLSLLLLVLVLVLLVLVLLVCFFRRPCSRSIIAPPWSGAEQGTSTAMQRAIASLCVVMWGKGGGRSAGDRLGVLALVFRPMHLSSLSRIPLEGVQRKMLVVVETEEGECAVLVAKDNGRAAAPSIEEAGVFWWACLLMVDFPMTGTNTSAHFLHHQYKHRDKDNHC